MENMFETAMRRKLRYTTTAGQLNTEDLWDVNLTGKVSLDNIAKDLRRQLKDTDEESFVTTTKPSTQTQDLQLKFEIVKYIISVKLREAAAARDAQDRAATKQKLMGVIQQKKDQHLEQLPVEELEKMLASL